MPFGTEKAKMLAGETYTVLIPTWMLNAKRQKIAPALQSDRSLTRTTNSPPAIVRTNRSESDP